MMGINQEVKRIYSLCVDSTYEETEYKDFIISLIDLRDLAIDGNYQDSEKAYKRMIKSILINQYNNGA